MYQIRPDVDAAVIGVTAIGSVWAHLKASQIIQIKCPCDPNGVWSFERGVIGNANGLAERVSDVTLGAAGLAPLIVDWADVGPSREWAEDMIIYVEVLSVNSALVTLANDTVQRPLPKSYAGDPKWVNSPGGYRSFYSFHTSTTFAALSALAMTQTLRHPDRWWLWFVTGAVGASVGYERVAAGRHFPTDVVMGALAGTLVGITIPWLHRRSQSETETGIHTGASYDAPTLRPSLAFVPLPGGALISGAAGF